VLHSRGDRPRARDQHAAARPRGAGGERGDRVGDHRHRTGQPGRPPRPGQPDGGLAALEAGDAGRAEHHRAHGERIEPGQRLPDRLGQMRGHVLHGQPVGVGGTGPAAPGHRALKVGDHRVDAGGAGLDPHD
jgi:hypothetical protein